MTTPFRDDRGAQLIQRVHFTFHPLYVRWKARRTAHTLEVLGFQSTFGPLVDLALLVDHHDGFLGSATFSGMDCLLAKRE